VPTPGSHSYDVKRAHKRDELDNQGIPDKNATIAANEELQADGPSENAAAGDDRARGPKGER
jgi:hypothetical protein